MSGDFGDDFNVTVVSECISEIGDDRFVWSGCNVVELIEFRSSGCGEIIETIISHFAKIDDHCLVV